MRRPWLRTIKRISFCAAGATLLIIATSWWVALAEQQGREAAQEPTAQYRCYPVATIGDILAGTR